MTLSKVEEYLKDICKNLERIYIDDETNHLRFISKSGCNYSLLLSDGEIERLRKVKNEKEVS